MARSVRGTGPGVNHQIPGPFREPLHIGVLEPDGLIIGANGNNLGLAPARAAELGVRFEVVSVRPSAHDLTQLMTLVQARQLLVPSTRPSRCPRSPRPTS